MDYNYMILLICILITIITIGIMIGSTRKTQETYVDQNIPSLTYCGRNMSFANFTSQNLASQRAISGTNYTQNITSGTCIIPGSNQNSANYETYSIIKDNYIFYSLKRGCLGFYYRNITTDNDRATITFDTSKEVNKRAFMYLMLLNPLFVEFNFNLEESSVAYFPVFHISAISSNTNSRTYDKTYLYSTYETTLISRYAQQSPVYSNPSITFEVVLPESKKASAYEATFDYFTSLNPYKRIQDLKTKLTDNDIDKNYVNMNIYFLDHNIPSSYQNVGKILKHPQNGNLMDYSILVNQTSKPRNLVVFTTDYNNKYSQNTQYKEIYEFNNNINVFFKNNVQPVFTVSIDFEIPIANKIGENIAITRMYMDNNYGNYSSCPRLNKDIDGSKKNNNMFMIALEFNESVSDNTGVNIVVALGKKESCNYDDTTNVKLPVPYLVNKKIRCLFTISPNEIIVMAMWKDADFVTKQISLARRTICTTTNLALANMFTVNPNPAPINNIIMNCNEDYVTSVNEIMLGYKNLLTEYNNF